MRIALYTINVKAGGGVIKKAWLLANFLVARGHSVDWYYPSRRMGGQRPPYMRGTLAIGLRLREVYNPLGIRVLDGFDLGNTCRAEDYDICQVISGFTSDGEFFRRKRVPYFLWVASIIADEKGKVPNSLGGARRLVSRISNAYVQSREKVAATGAQLVFANSEYTKSLLAEHLMVPAQKLRVGYPPVMTSERSAYKDAGIPKDPYLLFVGIHSPRKNLETLIAAFARVLEGRSDLNLVLIGRETPYTKSVRLQIERLGLQQRVLILGEVKGDLRDWYRHALVTVLPSIQEGFGMAIAESIANGTPAVGHIHSGSAEIIEQGQTGLLVDSRDPANISHAIEAILDSEEMRTYTCRFGAETMKNKFGIDRLGEQFIFEYLQAVNDTPAHV